MELLLTGKQMSDADRYTSESIGIPSLVLMERAALSVMDEILSFDPDARYRIIVLCGRGNNGADGLALVRLLTQQGRFARAVIMPGSLREGSSFGIQTQILNNLSVPIIQWGGEEWTRLSDLTELSPDSFLIVDSVSGTGFSGDLHGAALDAAAYCNRMKRAGAYIISVDLPSGVDAGSGQASDSAVYADETVTFGFRKLGSVLYPGAAHCGKVVLKDIGIPMIAADDILCTVPNDEKYFTLDKEDISRLPARPENGNKGTFGKVLILAGSRGMAGAAVLCAEAALRSGAGMVKVITPESNRTILQEKLPEAMLTTYPDGAPEEAEETIQAAVRWADSFAAGPGLGTGDAAARVLSCFIEAVSRKECHPALVLDADAIRLFAENSDLHALSVKVKDKIRFILTPHPGEFALLTGKSIEEIKRNSVTEGRTNSDLLNAVMVLKDARTKVLGPIKDEDDRTLLSGIFVNHLGNDGMATAGSGDVLTGIIASMTCRIPNSFDAASMGVLIHAAAGDLAALRKGKEGMTAADIAELTGSVLMERKNIPHKQG